MASLEERQARCALAHLVEPGDARVAALVAELGAARLHQALVEERDVGGLQTDTAVRLAAVEPERLLDQAARVGVRFVVPGDREWPVGLDDLAAAGVLHDRGGPPLGLWVRGPLGLDSLRDEEGTARAVAVVGSRSATTYGTDVAADLAHGLGHAGLVVVSGAAFGIDAAAHRGALSAGAASVAVLACGADRVYPQAHARLLQHLAAEHAVVSEAPPGWAPTRVRFLSRNRLIAAVAGGSVVVEAAVRSGALNTATWTDRLHRHLMAVPGPVGSAQSQGAHALVRDGAAVLVTGAADVLEVVGRSGEHLVEVADAPRSRDRLTPRQRQVLDAVPVRRPAGVESIARTAGVRLVDVRSALGRLQEAGMVVGGPEGWRLAGRDEQQGRPAFLDSSA